MTQISVIIPAFRPQGFDALVSSMAANEGVDAEWIVVDDGSGDDYDAIFDSLPKDVRVIRQAVNKRQGAARNIGLAAAKGQWVKFLDADDQLDTDHLAQLWHAAQSGAGTQAIAFAPTKHVFTNGTVSINDSWRDLPAEPETQLLRQIIRPFLHHCGALFPRDLLIELGGYDERLITDEDGDLLLRVLEMGWYFRPVEAVNYLYVHSDQTDRVSADNDLKKMQARVLACDMFLARLGDPIPPELAYALAQRMDKIAMTYWTHFPHEARMLLERARRLSPRYKPDMRGPLYIMRLIGGPRMLFWAQRVHRRLKGRPKGGAQG